MKFTDPQDRSVAAGEYVLGTLEMGARDEFEQALAHDPALRAEVYAWQDRLLGLARHVPPVEPVAQTWPTIEARLGAADAGARRPSTAANDPLWRRLRVWQTIGGLAVAASLLLAALLVLQLPGRPEPAAARYLAVLLGPDRSGSWVVEATVGGNVRLIPVGDTQSAPSGRVLQFWTKPQGAAGPTSLGLVPGGQVTEISTARLPALEEKQLFELTLEPAGGSPTGRPTGPVLYVGNTLRL